MPDITIQSEFAPRVDSNRNMENLYTPCPPRKGRIREINQNLLIFIFTQKLTGRESRKPAFTDLSRRATRREAKLRLVILAIRIFHFVSRVLHPDLALHVA